MLTHEEASPEEMQPYMAQVFYPLTPLVIYGRCATAEPKRSKEDAVWYAWRDREISQRASPLSVVGAGRSSCVSSQRPLVG